MDRKDGLLRSLLFVPGSDTRKLGKVARFGADAIVIDLEDAVADEEKVGARATTRAAIPDLAGKATLVVRVNGIETGLLDDDVAAIAVEGVDLIMVPKVESADTLAHLDDRIARAEEAAGIAPGTIRVLALIETARGIARLRGDPARGASERVAHRRLRRRGLLRAARRRPHARGHRARLRALAPRRRRPRRRPGRRRSTAPGCASRTTRAWRPTAGAPAGLGFQGRVTVYPPQVETVQRAYSALSDEEADRQRRVVEAFEEAEVAGRRLDPRRRPLRRLPDLPPGEGPHRALRRLAGAQRSRIIERARRSTACAWSTRRRSSPAP